MSIQTKTITSLSATTALQLVGTAQAEAASQGLTMCFAVVDRSGGLLAYAKVDGAPLHSQAIAIDKAITAVSFKRGTHTWDTRLADAPDFLKHGLMHRDHFAGFGGGLPLFWAGELVGAIGVSGGSAAQDQAVALAVATACGLTVE